MLEWGLNLLLLLLLLQTDKVYRPSLPLKFSLRTESSPTDSRPVSTWESISFGPRQVKRQVKRQPEKICGRAPLTESSEQRPIDVI